MEKCELQSSNLMMEESSKQSSAEFCLPGDVKLSFESLIPFNEKYTQQAANNTQIYPQRHLSSDSTNEQTETSEIIVKVPASTSASLPSLTELIPINMKDSQTNLSSQKVSVIKTDSQFIQYELLCAMNEAKTDYSKSKVSLESMLEDHLSQRQCKLEDDDDRITKALQTVRAYYNSMMEVEQVMRLSFSEIISDRIVAEFQKNLNLQKTKLAQHPQKLFMYSVFVIDQQKVYSELLKGVSINLLGLMQFSTSSFTEQLLRLGNTNLFDTQSNTALTLSRMQQYALAQQANNFEVSNENNLVLLIADGKQKLPVSSRSQIIPLCSSVIPNGHNFFFAFMHVTEVIIDDNLNLNKPNCLLYPSISQISSFTQIPSSSNLNSIQPQQQAYLQSCNELQEKYYALGQQRKKRYRKTKLQVEQELKYYLAKNLSNAN